MFPNSPPSQLPQSRLAVGDALSQPAFFTPCGAKLVLKPWRAGEDQVRCGCPHFCAYDLRRSCLYFASSAVPSFSWYLAGKQKPHFPDFPFIS